MKDWMINGLQGWGVTFIIITIAALFKLGFNEITQSLFQRVLTGVIWGIIPGIISGKIIKASYGAYVFPSILAITALLYI